MTLSHLADRATGALEIVHWRGLPRAPEALSSSKPLRESEQRHFKGIILDSTEMGYQFYVKLKPTRVKGVPLLEPRGRREGPPAVVSSGHEPRHRAVQSVKQTAFSL